MTSLQHLQDRFDWLDHELTQGRIGISEYDCARRTLLGELQCALSVDKLGNAVVRDQACDVTKSPSIPWVRPHRSIGAAVRGIAASLFRRHSRPAATV